MGVKNHLKTSLFAQRQIMPKGKAAKRKIISHCQKTLLCTTYCRYHIQMV